MLKEKCLPCAVRPNHKFKECANPNCGCSCAHEIRNVRNEQEYETSDNLPSWFRTIRVSKKGK